MTVWQLTFLTSINMMGSGIIMLPTKLAQVGTISILSWLLTVAGELCLAFCFAKCGTYSKYQGLGGYAYNAFGKGGSFLANYTYGISMVFANVALSVTCIGYLQQFLGVQFDPLLVCFLAICVLWICLSANFYGAAVTGRIGSIVIWCVLIPVLGIGLIGWFWFSPTMYIEAWNPHDTPFFEAIKSSIAMTLWAFMGIESACSNSQAVDNPEKNVPIAIMTATICVAIIYISSTNVIAGIVPNAELAQSNAPFGLVYSTIFNGTVGKFVMFLLVLSCANSTLGWQFTLSRLCLQASQQGFFPKIFSKVNKWGSPVKGMILLGCLQSCFCLLTVSPKLFSQFNKLVDLAVVMTIIPYLLSMAALGMILKNAHVDPSKAKIYVGISVIASLYSLYAVDAAGPTDVFWGAMATFFGWTIWGFLADKFAHTRHTPAQ